MADQSNTLDLMLCYATNTDLNPTEHARNIRKCAKIVSQTTNDKSLKIACKALRSQKNNMLVVGAARKAFNILLPEVQAK